MHMTCLGAGRVEYLGHIIESVTGEPDNYRIVLQADASGYLAQYFPTTEAAVEWIEDVEWGHYTEFGTLKNYHGRA